MPWHPLSFWLRELQQYGQGMPRSTDLRRDAALLALSAIDARLIPAAPESVNIAALALTIDRLTVHQVSPGVVRRVAETDLQSLPDESPRLLRTSWLIEVSDPSRELLFGRTAALGGYQLDGITYLVGIEWPDGIWVSQWRPAWGGGELVAGVPLEIDDRLIAIDGGARGLQETGREAARLAVVLGLLLEAEGSPVTLGDPVPGMRGRRASGRGRLDAEWVTRRIYLDSRAHTPARPSRAGTGEDLPADRLPTTVEVTGHLKRQPYGPGRTERRWIYVASYEARRWVAPRPLRIVVT